MKGKPHAGKQDSVPAPCASSCFDRKYKILSTSCPKRDKASSKQKAGVLALGRARVHRNVEITGIRDENTRPDVALGRVRKTNKSENVLKNTLILTEK